VQRPAAAPPRRWRKDQRRCYLDGGCKDSGGTTSAGRQHLGRRHHLRPAGTTSAGGTTSNGVPAVSRRSRPMPHSSQERALLPVPTIRQPRLVRATGSQLERQSHDVSWLRHPVAIKTRRFLSTDFAYHSSAGCTGCQHSTTHALPTERGRAGHVSLPPGMPVSVQPAWTIATTQGPTVPRALLPPAS